MLTTPRTLPYGILAGLLALGLQAVPAQAQLARTYVSAATGNDNNNCDRPTPCRTFQVAHDKTNADGEITVLDPGGYGAVTINKTISIINDGVGEAGVLVSGGAVGITINAAQYDKINLRGLTVKGIGFGGGNGIDFNSGGMLTIENCAIRNMNGSGVTLDGSGPGNGIRLRPNTVSRIAVTHTMVTDNWGFGILLQPTASASQVGAVLNRVETYNHGYDGFAVDGRKTTGKVNAVVTDSVLGGPGAGIEVVSAAGKSTPVVTVIRSTIAEQDSAALSASTGSTVRVGQSVITGNGFSWWALSGGTVVSYGDNYINGNNDGDPAPPVIAKK
jgi:hypothetical protein